jgi:glycosyltransferase involved in cell wall biosynthesis
MSLTVVVCTHNPDREVLREALDAVHAQLGEVGDGELVVVDNASVPALAQDELPPSATLIAEPTPGLTAAREAGIGRAHGELLVFVDDDNILAPGFLRGVEEAFDANPELGMLGAAVEPRYEVPPPAWLSPFEEMLAVRRYPADTWIETREPRFTSAFPIGAGMAVRRDVAEAYAEDLRFGDRIEGRRGNVLSSGEDLDMAFFALSRGHVIAVSGALRLTHVIGRGRLTVEYLQRLAVSNVASSQQLERKWSARFGRPVVPMFELGLLATGVRYVGLTPVALVHPAARLRRSIYGALVRARLGLPVRLRASS